MRGEWVDAAYVFDGFIASRMDAVSYTHLVLPDSAIRLSPFLFYHSTTGKAQKTIDILRAVCYTDL